MFDENSLEKVVPDVLEQRGIELGDVLGTLDRKLKVKTEVESARVTRCRPREGKKCTHALVRIEGLRERRRQIDIDNTNGLSPPQSADRIA